MRTRSFELTWRPVLLGVVGITGILSIIASGGGGGGGGAGTATSTTVPRYAFVASNNDNSVSTYVVDTTIGRLKWIGKVAAGGNPQSVAVDPSGKYVYVANYSGNSVSAYTIAASGALTQINCGGVTGCATNPADFSAGASPYSVTIDPSGKHVYVANSGASTVSQYTIGANGALTSIATAVGSGAGPASVTIDPSGKYAYVANSAGGSVSAYTIDATTGALNQINCGGGAGCTSTLDFTAGNAPYSVTVDPSSKFVYVTNRNSNSVSAYTISASTGALTQINCGGGAGCSGTVNFATGSNPVSVTVNPAGKYAYVANSGGGSVSAYTIDATTGALTKVACSVSCSGSDFLAGLSPDAITVDPSGKYIYVANATSMNVSEFSIGSNGSLTALSPATVAAWAGSSGITGPAGIAVSRGSAAVAAVPNYAYVANYNDATVSPYSIGSDGHLTAIDCDSGTVGVQACPAGNLPYSVTVDPSGKYAYVANSGDSTVSRFIIGANGVLNTNITIGSGAGPASVAVDPAGRYVYTANSGAGSVSAYNINAATGALTPISCGGGVTCTNTVDFTAGAAPYSVTVDPSGKYVYVVNRNDATVSQFSIGTNGGLTGIATPIGTGSVPQSIAVDPSGKYAYVTNSGGTSVTPYSIGSNGSLTVIDCDALTGGVQTCPTGASPFGIAIDPSGKYAYVANNANANVSQYSIGTNGTLTAMSPNPTANADQPISVAVDPSGKYAYVANNIASGTVWQYTIGSSGSLTSMVPGSVTAGNTSISITTTGTWQ